MSNFTDVVDWQRLFKFPTEDRPTLDYPDEVFDLRLGLIEEEYEELRVAIADRDIVEVADALGDLLYVVYGMGATLGIDLDRVFAEVQRSNMTKLGRDGKPVIRFDGKIMKGPDFEPPDLRWVEDERQDVFEEGIA